jgi:hypothetical protein
MEFIEIYNVSPNAINLEGLSVILINGANTYIYNTIDLSGLVAVAPGEFLVIKSPNLEIISPGVLTVDFPDQENNIQNGPSDAVQLVLDLGGPGEISIDSVSYDGDLSPYTETSSAPGDIGSGSIGRIGGQDTNDNSVDFTYFDTPSPGLPNQ